MAVVEAQNLEVMWILLVRLAAYVGKLDALAPTRLGFFCFALDVYMTRRTNHPLHSPLPHPLHIPPNPDTPENGKYTELVYKYKYQR